MESETKMREEQVRERDGSKQCIPGLDVVSSKNHKRSSITMNTIMFGLT